MPVEIQVVLIIYRIHHSIKQILPPTASKKSRRSSCPIFFHDGTIIGCKNWALFIKYSTVLVHIVVQTTIITIVAKKKKNHVQ